MSVVVMGMEIPKDCDSCWLPERICNLWLATDLNKRHSGCPIRPLPEKHGRLIDAEAYATEMKKRQDNAMLWKEKAERNNDMTIFSRGDQAMRTFSEAKLTLDNMETIVESEG